MRTAGRGTGLEVGCSVLAGQAAVSSTHFVDAALRKPAGAQNIFDEGGCSGEEQLVKYEICSGPLAPAYRSNVS